jgi:metal-responsive CopG/Arc/MetJ family transcriptional regulator
MSSYIQKKFSIDHNHKEFLENYKKLGFAGQSSIVREALSLFIKEFETKKRKTSMAQKAQELVTDYKNDSDLTAFTSLDGEDFHEAR